MSGKFDSLRDEVVYRATLDGADDTIGSVDELGWFGLVEDFYGSDYIVSEDHYGFVSVETFPEHILIDDTGYYNPVRRRWAEIEDAYGAFYDDEDEDGTS